VRKSDVLEHKNGNTLCLKENDTDVAHYTYDTHEGILIIFGRYVPKEISN